MSISSISMVAGHSGRSGGVLYWRLAIVAVVLVLAGTPVLFGDPSASKREAVGMIVP